MFNLMCDLQGQHSGTQKMKDFILVKFSVKNIAIAFFAIKRSGTQKMKDAEMQATFNEAHNPTIPMSS